MLEYLNSYDWEEAFGEGSGGNTDKKTEVVPPNSSVDPSPFNRSDVEHIVCAIDGENDGPEWVGIFLLSDGRVGVVEAGCDYTGWDCQAGNRLVVCSTIDDAFRFGIGDANRQRLFGNTTFK